MNLNTLQQEVGEWARRNFPTAEPWYPLLGVGEELGELAAAQLESSIEPAIESQHAKKVDAVGDVVVFLADYCERNVLDLAQIEGQIKTWCEANDVANIVLYNTMRPDPQTSLLNLQVYVGDLMHAHLKRAQGIRGTPEQHQMAKQEAVNMILWALAAYCFSSQINLWDCVTKTWDHVKQRDWLKNKDNGGVPANV